MTIKHLALLTLDEALAQEPIAAPSAYGEPQNWHRVSRRPPAPSRARLPSRTRELVLPHNCSRVPFPFTCSANRKWIWPCRR